MILKKKTLQSTLINRHKNAWTNSWERISLEEIALTEEIYHDNLCLMMPSPITSYTLNVTKNDKSLDHRQMAKRLGFIEDELDKELQQNTFETVDDILGLGFPFEYFGVFSFGTKAKRSSKNSIVLISKRKNPSVSTKDTYE